MPISRNVNITANGSGTQFLSDAGTYGTPAGGTDFVKLDEVVVGSAVPSVTFSSISASYRNLKLIVTARYDAAGTDFIMQFNGDTGANYQSALSYAGSGSGQSAAFSQTSASIGSAATSAAPANQAAINEINIPDYAGTTFYKSATGYTHRLDGASTAYLVWYGLTWNNTAAISSIKLTAGAGNFVTGSVFTLYGMK